MILAGTLNGLKGLMLPIIFIALGGMMDGEFVRSLIIIAVGVPGILVLLLIYYTLSWAYYTYRYEKGYLHIKAGILFKKERSIKQERVQTVNIRIGILQRLLGLASIQVETAGGGMESELKLSAVTLEEANNIKKNLEGFPQKEKSDSETAAIETETKDESYKKTAAVDKGNVYKVPLGDLFLAGATSGGFLTLFALISAVFSQIYPMVPDAFWDYLVEQITSTALGTIVLVVLSLLILSWLISIAIFMVQHADFTLYRSQDQLQIGWGIIERKQVTLKLHRLQAISIQDGLLRQPFGLCSLAAEVAGGGSQDQEYVTMLYPLMRRRKLKEFLGEILPEYEVPDHLNRLPARALKRYVLRAVLFSLLLIVPLQWVPYGQYAFLLLIPAIVYGVLCYRAGGTAIVDNQLVMSFRGINRYRILIKKSHLQSFEVSANPFQRWGKLCSIEASVLSSPAGKSFQVVDVEREEALRIWKWYSRIEPGKR